MGILDFFKRQNVVVRENILDESSGAALLQSLVNTEEVNSTTALNVPAISACVNKIADTVASLNIKLYHNQDGKIEEVTDDYRLKLLNDDTGDTLDATQFKKAMIMDMFLEKGGYAYINKNRGKIKSVHYVDAKNVSFEYNSDPIFKDYQILVNGKRYEDFQFVKLLRNTKNGYSGKSIIEESKLLFNIVYASQKFEKNLVSTGGNKKGFIQSTVKLSKEAMQALKDAFRRLYSSNSENVVILNDGLTFKESSNTSVEMQLNENKKTNGDNICKVFLIPPSIINGGATEDDRKLYYESCILPILERFNTAINRVFLKEVEKDEYFFAFDDYDLTKGDIEKRFKAYEIACKNGFMQIDEVRKNEKLPAFELDFVKLGLQDVLYFPDRKEVYTPNTNKLSVMGEVVTDSGASPIQNIDSEEEQING